MNQVLTVRIVSPKKDLFGGVALSVSSTNSAGKFDILPQHANFITVVEGNPISVKIGTGQILSFNFPLAIIHTQNNRVNIYTDFTHTSK